MAADLTPPFDWALVADLFDRPLYDASSAKELFLTVGAPADGAAKAEVAALRLSEIGKSFAFSLWRGAQPSADNEAAAALRVAAACGAVLTLTGLGVDDSSPDRLLPSFGSGGLFAAAHLRGEPNGKAATMNALRAVDLLRRDALAMAEQRARRSRMKLLALCAKHNGFPVKAGRVEARAIKGLVADLAAFYFDVWGAVPTVSRSKANATSGEVAGAFVRLLSAVNAALQARGLRYYATDESLVQHWRSLSQDRRLRFNMVKKG